MAFDLVGAMCKCVGNAGYTGSKQQMWHLLATERFCNILESSAEASVELQQLTSQEHALHELITALVTPSASFTLGAAAEPSE